MGVKKGQYLDSLKKRGGYFTQVPNELWAIKELDAIAVRIWCYILSEGGSWKSSRNNIAKNLGISRQTVTDRVNALTKLNMLKYTLAEDSSWNFEILPIEQWSVNLSPIMKVKLPGGSKPHNPGAGYDNSYIQEDTNKKNNSSESIGQADTQPYINGYKHLLMKERLYFDFEDHIEIIEEFFGTIEFFKDYLEEFRDYYHRVNPEETNEFKYRSILKKRLSDDLGL